MDWLSLYPALATPSDTSTYLGILLRLQARNEHPLDHQLPRTVATGRSDRGRGSAGHDYV